MTKRLEIRVRSITATPAVEWTKTVHSWTAAWAIVDDVCDSRDEAQAWCPDQLLAALDGDESLAPQNKQSGFWFLDIGE